MKTFNINIKDIKHNWYIIDAKGKILGRLATKIAHYLRGKHKVKYSPHIDLGDYIIVLNSNKIIVSGNKNKNKIYYNYTGYVGGLKKISFEEMIKKYSERIIKLAVKGMLPKGPLGRTMINKMKIYTDNNHRHIAQQPKTLNI